MTSATFEGSIPWVTTDGTYLYGLSFEDGQPYRLDPASPEPEPVDCPRDQGGYPIHDLVSRGTRWSSPSRPWG